MLALPPANQPRAARGMFVEYSLGPPPLALPFQFNPLQLQRGHSLSFDAPGEQASTAAAETGASGGDRAVAAGLRGGSLRKMHQDKRYEDLLKLQDRQLVAVQEETISLEIRLDATDAIDAGDPTAARLGVAPRLAILEQMVTPREGTLLGEILQKIPGADKRYSFTRGANPPLILFVWGGRWALPVNISSMSITESEFNLGLYPLRATVAVSLTVIEGPNAPYKASLRAREALAAAGMAGGVVNVVDLLIPG
jgi:hypothetical protein